MTRSWDVLVVGGPSGVGKSTAAYPIARAHGVGITEVDDLHIMATSLTTPEQQPVLHFWTTNPSAPSLDPEEIVRLHLDVCRVMAPGVAAVITNHLVTDMPVVLDGDYLLPETVAAAGGTGGRVRGVFVYESDADRVAENLQSREPSPAGHSKRAQVSVLLGEWLRAECVRLGVAAVPALPFDTLVERIEHAAS